MTSRSVFLIFYQGQNLKKIPLTQLLQRIVLNLSRNLAKNIANTTTDRTALAMSIQMGRFTGKKVLVTGGNSGMGFDTAKEFILEGAEVFITGRNKETLITALKELGPKAKMTVSDSASLKDIAILAETIKREFGHLDAAFINAGMSP
jgi:hypothetical protein